MTYRRKHRESWLERKQRERGERAINRQLDYQEDKSRTLSGDSRVNALRVKARALKIRERLEGLQESSAEDRVLEVGSGAHGLIFGFDDVVAVGLDPLAVEYNRLFPAWQNDANTIAAIGEELPFDDESFDLVMSDNVVDHAADPIGIIHELARVLKPGGVLYFSVNTHHPVYQAASVLHGLWNAVGIRFEIGPFADHTIHFTESRVQRVFRDLPLEILWETEPFRRTKENLPPKGGLENKIKRTFHKNILFEVIAKKTAG